MANVYLGERSNASGDARFAAIKLMQPQLLSDPQSTSMFFDEARITASIHHPAVCRVLDFGMDAGVPYLVTEYVLGEMLCDLMEALHASPEGRALCGGVTAYLVAQACQGLHAAHELRGPDGSPLHVVHRDMAPQNIMVGYDGQVRVLDFGIARSADQLHQSQSGVLRGRFPYMAPEQLAGGSLDRRADIWSLGVILWEGATGQRLFKRDSISETMRAVIADPLSPMLRGSGIHPALLEVAERSVVRDASLRYATARQMGEELARLTNTGPRHIQVLMQRAFEERFQAKRRMLAATSSHRAAVQEFKVSRPVVVESLQVQSESGVSASSGSFPAPLPRVPSSSGTMLRPSPYSEADSQALPLPSQAIASVPAQATMVGARSWDSVMPRQKKVAALVVSALVTASLLAFDASMPSREGPKAPRAEVLKHSDEPQEVQIGAALGAVQEPLSVAPKLGEVELIFAAKPTLVRVDGIPIRPVAGRLLLSEGPHVVELWSGPPDLPVVMPVQVVAGQALKVSLPSSGRPHP